jgi:alginate O-acetyltransferase complex protein AlgF
MIRLTQSLLLSLLLASFAALAQQDGNAGLYGTQAPANSAYVRVLNLSPAVAELTVTGKSRSQKVNGGQLGAYLFVAPGARKISVNQASLDSTLAANSATTLIYDGSKLEPITETFSEDPKKALVAFYNLTGKPLALKTQDGKHAIVESVAGHKSGSRQVNELKIGFAAFDGEQSIAKFDEQLLKKGRSYSYMVIEDGGQYRTISLANSLEAFE